MQKIIISLVLTGFCFILLNNSAFSADSTALRPQNHRLRIGYVLATGKVNNIFVENSRPYAQSVSTSKTCGYGYIPKESVSIASTKGNIGEEIVLKGININYRTTWANTYYVITFTDAYANPAVGSKQPIWIAWSINCLPDPRMA